MIGKLLYRYRKVTAGIIGVIIFVFMLPTLTPIMAQTQSSCDEKIKLAEQKFYDGLFDDAIALLNSCLKESSVTKQERARAHELLAKVYLGKDYQEQAESAIRKLLELVPSYTPNPDKDTPTYVALVEKVKSEQAQPKEQPEEQAKQDEKKSWYENTWVIVGAGVAVVGAVVAVLLLTKKEEDKKKPPTPVYPD
ncbi:MAG: hypothetical protein QME58_10935 [Bacteroidota bacterium]|nr:hypothetical protein [Bacteroidota bacterium]